LVIAWKRRPARKEQLLTLHQLKIFNLVAKHLNISKAAREIRTSQPTVSKQLRLLEEECGVKFHTRLTQGVALTEEGRLFWNVLQPILSQFDDLQRTFATAKEKRRILTVGATQGLSVSLVPDLIQTFREMHPDVQSIVRIADSRTIEQMLLRSEVDLALILYPSYHPRIVVEKLWSENIAAVVSAKHSLARKKQLSQEEFLKVPVVLRMGGRIAAFLRERRFDLNIAMKCDSIEAVRAAVESGVGIGLLYGGNVEHNLASKQLKTIQIPCLKDIRIHSFMIHRKGEELARHGREFVKLLRRLSRHYRSR
jgi:DNA-binding transcriptional LysR family regulator